MSQIQQLIALIEICKTCQFKMRPFHIFPCNKCKFDFLNEGKTSQFR